MLKLAEAEQNEENERGLNPVQSVSFATLSFLSLPTPPFSSRCCVARFGV